MIKLRQAELLKSQGKAAAEAMQSSGVKEVTYHRRRKEFDGLKLEEFQRLKELGNENDRLQRAGSNLKLDYLMLF